MTFPFLHPLSFLNYLLKREINKFFASIAIRYFAIGMITIFEPIYIYKITHSLSLTLLFFAAVYGLYGILSPLGGISITKIGIKKSMMISHPFFIGFYICLLFLKSSVLWLFLLAIILRAIGMLFFWPAFHTDFSKFSRQSEEGKEVGKLNFICTFPGILAPLFGGIIIERFGYSTVFIVILCLLITSAIPLFLSREVYQIYTDSYKETIERIRKKKNRYLNLSLIAESCETGINFFLWPLFLITLGISFENIGGLSSVALMVGAFFTLYMGKITDKIKPKRVLIVGSILTSGAWIGKYFVFDTISGFLAQSIYRLFRTSAQIPFQTIFYDKAKDHGSEMDEFIILREMIVNLSRSVLFLVFSGIFLFTSKVNITFPFAAVFSLMFMLILKKTSNNSLKKIIH